MSNLPLQALSGTRCAPSYETTKNSCQTQPPLHAVAGWWFQPIWKILVKLQIFPKYVNMKSIWNHHLGHFYMVEASPRWSSVELDHLGSWRRKIENHNAIDVSTQGQLRCCSCCCCCCECCCGGCGGCFYPFAAGIWIFNKKQQQQQQQQLNCKGKHDSLIPVTSANQSVRYFTQWCCIKTFKKSEELYR